MTAERDGRGQGVREQGVREQSVREQSGARDQSWDEDMPGDPVCWLRRVCPACGTLADEEPPTTCQQCHAAIPVP